jgi:putative glycosyltransferase (TIGR04372 family)
MGAAVHDAIKSMHPKIIDYATNGMRSDFMDIFLGGKCTFCISTGSGWDAVPEMFRIPIAYVNFAPLGCLHTFRSDFLAIAKKHVWRASQKVMTLKEIFFSGVGFCGHASGFESKGVELVENTPEEIRSVVAEMLERLAGTWQMESEDEILQKQFWSAFAENAVDTKNGNVLHGEIRSRFGAAYLRNNREWLR